MAKKRHTGGGRYTPPKRSLARARATGHDPEASTPRASRVRPDGSHPERTVGPSSRHTPPRATFRRRPRWHRVAGLAGVALGVAIALVNDAMLFTEGTTLLPFGHQELYLLLGLSVAGASTWFLGLFDRGTTVYD